MPSSLHVAGLHNLRDLGGHPRRTGGHTPYGVFWRSENLHLVDADGWEQLRAAGIRTVVDLRQPAERTRTPYRAPEWVVTAGVDHDGLENVDFWSGYWENGLVGTALYYLPHLAAMPERTRAVFEALAAAPPGGVLFHCARGRDRTGLVAALLLAAADTEPEAIVADYLHSAAVASARAASTGEVDPEVALQELCNAHGTTTEGAFRDALAGFDLPALLDGTTHGGRAAVLTWRGHL